MYSWLPCVPWIFEGMMPCHFLLSFSVVKFFILSCASWRSDSFRTMPPLLILSGWSSNWGLIRHMIEPVGLSTEKALGSIFVREMKDKSMTMRSTGSPRSSTLRFLALNCSFAVTWG